MPLGYLRILSLELVNSLAKKQIVSAARQKQRSSNQECAQVDIALYDLYGSAENTLSSNGTYDRQNIASNRTSVKSKKRNSQ